MYMFDSIYQWRDIGPMQTLTVTYPLFYKDTFSAKALTPSMPHMNHVCKHLDIYAHFTSRSWYSADKDQLIMALAFNDNCVIYYHLGAQHSSALAWTYFTNFNY